MICIYIDITIAKLLFNLASIGLFLYSLKRLATFYSISAVYVLVLPILFFVPLRNEILFGQVYLLLFFFLSEYWLAYEKKHFMKAATFLALAILLKVFPILLLAIFVFKKEWKPALFTVGVCIILVLLTLLFCDTDVWFFYLQQVLPKASAGGIASAYVENYQSVYMFLKRLFVFDSTENSNGWFYFPVLFQALMVTFKVLLLCIGYYLTRKIAQPLFVISYWMLAMIVISPYGSTYTFLLLLFPYFAIVKSDMTKPMKMTCVLLLALVCNFPLSVFMTQAFPLSYLRLFFLIGLFVMIIYALREAVNWKVVSMISAAVLLGVVIFRNAETLKSTYFLHDGSPLLVYDYKIGNGNLTYYYWTENGENNGAIPIRASKITKADLSQNHNYYFGKRIDTESGNKLKPIVIDDTTLLYLSDHGRGIGFYTLRKLQLK